MTKGRILLLGATGRLGKEILKLALNQGYKVNCLVRDSSRVLPQKGLKLFEGDVLNSYDLELSAQNCDYVLSALNISRTSDFPWSPLRTETDFLSNVAGEIIKLNNKKPFKRIIVCTAWGTSDTFRYIPFWFRFLIKNSNIGIAYADHEKAEMMFKESNVPYTIVRPVGLTNGKLSDHTFISFENSPKPKLTISRKSVAAFMLKSIVNDKLIQKMPVISS
jgi:NAD dependent epimerase/dehydratase family enzyme